jgi:hypothetical protein
MILAHAVGESAGQRSAPGIFVYFDCLPHMHGKNKVHAHAKLHDETCQMLFKDASGLRLLCIPAKKKRTAGGNRPTASKSMKKYLIRNQTQQAKRCTI